MKDKILRSFWLIIDAHSEWVIHESYAFLTLKNAGPLYFYLVQSYSGQSKGQHE